jgi:hypothetical protein
MNVCTLQKPYRGYLTFIIITSTFDLNGKLEYNFIIIRAALRMTSLFSIENSSMYVCHFVCITGQIKELKKTKWRNINPFNDPVPFWLTKSVCR